MDKLKNKTTVKNLFYTKSDKTLFWIAGFTQDDNESKVHLKIEHLRKAAEEFAEVAKCPFDSVNTYFITNDWSPYKYMRVFFVETDYIPKKCHVIDELEWNMFKWLTR